MKICVYCSSSSALDEKYFQLATELGEIIAINKFELVYGGSSVGLMHKLADSVKNKNGKVIGVIPKMFVDMNIAYKNADELIITNDLRDRKAIMEQKSDAFIALPGGFGTLDEIIEIITLKQLQIHNKPIVFINSFKFFEGLKQQIAKSFAENFAKPEYNELFYFAENPKEAVQYIKDYTPKILEKKWFG